MHTLNYTTAGKDIREADKALIMLHGRGGSAEDILSLADALPVGDFAIFAPQAAAHSWYPYSFLMPPAKNEPWLSSALDVLQQLVDVIGSQAIAPEQLYFLGFSQGACLTLEFITRNARRYGGAVAFTGGLIGDRIYPRHYKGDFEGTPVFIGTGDPDPHVPVGRVHDTTAFLKGMNALVTEKVYPGMGHTISEDELRQAGRLLLDASYT
ncbi:MAG TPA: dienelactone hydrolase family protein [Puia sp.]|jgi:phospholipase/carboxylesterase|nr:dienelactone hydrolase family protein [Puia sp.]